MQNIWKTMRFAAIFGGICVSAGQLLAADVSEVIRDKEWTIKIRPSYRGNRNTKPVEELQQRRVTPASYQAPAPEAVPVPESEAPAPAPADVKPAPIPVKNDVKPEPQKPIGPELPSAPGASPATQVDPAARSVDMVPGIGPANMSYAEAYAAVPFSRTEYEANPTYRPQAALELMFHTLRPTTMVQNFTPRTFRYPDSYQIPYSRSDTQHINVRNFGGGWNGQSPFGYPYGLKGNW
ncbi:MAG: hypothetical protein JWM11_3568 [Planctomycetaceae bacterium]|nr:hypothetical protein [Planctomycetaceae bacterium]